jgi:HEAT repeat protein
MREERPNSKVLSTAEVIAAARAGDTREHVLREQRAARAKLEENPRYSGPRYRGRTVDEWVDRASAGLASIGQVRDAFLRITPAAESSVPQLISLLRHRSPHFRHIAAVAMGRIGPAAQMAVPHLIHQLRDPHAAPRYGALEALLAIGVSRSEAAPLAMCLQDPDKAVRRLAADTLGSLGPDAATAVEALINVLNDDQVIGHAAAALGQIGLQAAPAVPALAKVLSHEFVEYRCAAAAALAQIGTPEALAAVRPALKDRWKTVRDLANRIVQLPQS